MVSTFQHWRRITKDLPHSGAFKLWDIKDIRRVLEENPQKSTCRPSEELGASKDTIHRKIKTLEKSYRSCRSVPHELTPQEAQCRVISIVSLLVISWMIDLSGELSHVMKNVSIITTLMPRNSGLILINQPKSLLKNIGSAPK